MIGTKTLTARESIRPTGQAWPYLAIDLETCHAPEAEINAALARWEPPSNVRDPEKIEARRMEAVERIREKSALLDGAPIACVSLAVPANRTVQVYTISAISTDSTWRRTAEGTSAFGAGSEDAMLLELREVLDANTCAESIMVGFNVVGFDLPKLRVRYAVNGLRLPRVLVPPVRKGEEGQPVADVMPLFLRYFSPELHREQFISFAEVLDRLGMPEYKSDIRGELVPKMIAEGRIAEVLAYCGVDAAASLAAWLKLTGAAAGMR